MTKRRKIVVILFSFVFMTGCWDRVEIEERGFVIGAAVDVPKEESEPGDEPQEEREEEEGRPKGKRRMALTYQLVLPGKLGAGGASPSGDTEAVSFLNVTSTGDSLFSVTREMGSRMSRTPYLQHLKVLLVSRKLAEHKGDFANTVDFFIRFHETRRNTHVFIVENERASDALDIRSSFEELTVDYIDSVAENYRKTSRMLEPVTIGQLEENLLVESNYVIPRLIIGKEGIVASGAAIFDGKGNRMVGILSDERTKGLNYLRGKVKQDVILGQIKDNLIGFVVTRTRHRLEVDDRDKENLKFTVKLDVEGEVGESLETLNHLREEASEKVRESIEKEIKRLCDYTARQLQNEYKVDVIGLDKYLRGHRPKLWEEIKEDWDGGKNYFSKSKIDVKVNVVVNNPGIITESEIR